MVIEYVGVKEINGSLIVLDGVKNASFEETVVIRLQNGKERTGRIVQIEGERVVVQVFEGAHGISLTNA
ncbi:MAG TPA: V-type ATP synthase subunit B, partial [Ruminococcaceae bacterium]|nr:V-type ATP synthase subunit B [Oscillospiraceae bacterium]